jgi:hypothetical protein
MENQSVPVCILLISQWCSSRNCTQIWVCFAIWVCCIWIYEHLFAITAGKINEFVQKYMLKTCGREL